MTPLFKSIRWRLQAWHGLMLLVVLAAFGFTAYYLVFDNRMRRVDAELQRRALPFVAMMNRFGPGDGPAGRFRRGPGGPGGPPGGQRPPEDRPPVENYRPSFEGGEDEPPRPLPGADPRRPDPRWFEGRNPDGARPPDGMRADGRGPDGRGPEGFRGPPGVFPFPPEMLRSFEETGAGGYYFVIWSPENEELRRSTNAPAMATPPALTAAPDASLARTHAGHREFVQRTRRGAIVLTGHDITPDLAELNQLAWLLAAAGGGVLLLGLAGGWWLSTRAIRPIEDISSTAVKIAGGDLDQRINVTDADSELGQLAKVLNNTFDRLEKSFARQVQFTADASHELRTPVSVVLSQTQTALKRERTSGEYRDTIAACQRAARRMQQLVESLLTLARLDAGTRDLIREPCELDHIAADAVDLLQPLVNEQNLKLTTKLETARCSGDAQQLSQVVTNLVSNAIHYNRTGGEVGVEVTMDGSSALLRVTDTGHGIAAEDLPHIFERFYRADKSRSRSEGHTGLGLAITKAIVEAHGGTIVVRSEEGKGSTFEVRLPALAAGTR
jgi:two-component system, OmpR family, sensor kinase